MLTKPYSETPLPTNCQNLPTRWKLILDNVFHVVRANERITAPPRRSAGRSACGGSLYHLVGKYAGNTRDGAWQATPRKFKMTIAGKKPIGQTQIAVSPDAADDDSRPWFLAYTRPGHEALAQQHLERQAFESYLPQYKRLKKSAAGVGTVFEPMFPRYVFFRPGQTQQSLAPVRSTRGISHIIRFGGTPATIQPETLGIIRLLEQERNATDAAELSSLQPGQKVRFRHVVFSGFEGLVKSVSSRRVTVLLELMGRQQLLHADHHLLEKV